jgi:predicted transcriptional regulator
MSEAEKQIMEFIWVAGRPVTTTEIIANLPEDNFTRGGIKTTVSITPSIGLTCK